MCVLVLARFERLAEELGAAGAARGVAYGAVLEELRSALLRALPDFQALLSARSRLAQHSDGNSDGEGERGAPPSPALVVAGTDPARAHEQSLDDGELGAGDPALARELLLSRIVCLVRHYTICFPGAVAAAKFDVARLLPSGADGAPDGAVAALAAAPPIVQFELVTLLAAAAGNDAGACARWMGRSGAKQVAVVFPCVLSLYLSSAHDDVRCVVRGLG